MGIALHYLYSCYSPRPLLKPEQTEAFGCAQRLSYGPGGRGVAWAWGASGPLVVLVHGWGGSAGQLAPLARGLAEQGYRVVAPDITGHGASPGRRTAWEFFFRDLAALQATLQQEIHAYAGHSVGGLAMMAARHLTGIHARHYICICSPYCPYKGAEFLTQRIAPSAAGMKRYREFVARKFGGASWAALEACGCYAGAGEETLLIYDLDDRFVSHHDAEKITAAYPDVQVTKLQAHGHLRILTTPELVDTMARFLGTAQGASGGR